MPRIPELQREDAPASVRKMMDEQESYFGFVLNPLKLMGYRPGVAEGAQALMLGVEDDARIEGRLRSLLYARVASLNGCPF